MTHTDPFTLRRRAQQLRREELRRIAHAAVHEWSTFLRFLARPWRAPLRSYPRR